MQDEEGFSWKGWQAPVEVEAAELQSLHGDAMLWRTFKKLAMPIGISKHHLSRRNLELTFSTSEEADAFMRWIEREGGMYEFIR